jgi:hypothetical protein
MYGVFVILKLKKRKLDKMVSAETVDCGKMKEAATKKADESILVQISIQTEIHVP